MRFNHLALPVADARRSLAFYEEVVGLKGAPREVVDGILFTTAEGFVLAFLDSPPTPGDGRLHFGFSRESGEDVHQLRTRLRKAGVEEIDWIEMDGFVSMKFADPDGYVLEVFWEKT